MRIQVPRWMAAAAVVPTLASLEPARAASDDAKIEALTLQMEQLVQQNEQMQSTIDALRSDVDRARDATPLSAYGVETETADALLSAQVGRATFQLLDVSLGLLTSAGTSKADDRELEVLQGGEHDPRQRGFNLQQLELSLAGAVDPYLTGEAHLIYFLDTEGESKFELEEAFATTTMLPFHLEEQGFEVEMGHFFTEFGRINPQHPHEWDWQDQPFVLTRFFGGDGMRAPGARVGWLTPLPWFSELHFGMQNAKGETMVSFLANNEVFEERPIGGRPFADVSVNGFEDFVYLARWVNGFDWSDTVSSQLGVSALFGPNATGNDGRTRIVGADLVVKWMPLTSDRGWPFLTFQSEALYRSYKTDNFSGPVSVSDHTIEDWGLYAQLLWGFQRDWAAGVRYEYAGGSSADVGLDEVGDALEVVSVSRNDDPFRGTRHRVSPLVSFHPSEFSRFRIQYNYDRQEFLSDRNIHSIWAGVEVAFGAHAAHGY